MLIQIVSILIQIVPKLIQNEPILMLIVQCLFRWCLCWCWCWCWCSRMSGNLTFLPRSEEEGGSQFSRWMILSMSHGTHKWVMNDNLTSNINICSSLWSSNKCRSGSVRSFNTGYGGGDSRPITPATSGDEEEEHRQQVRMMIMVVVVGMIVVVVLSQSHRT